MALELKNLRGKISQLNGPVLTIYLATDPSHEDWKIRLKNGLKRIGEYVKASQPDEHKQFLSIQEKVETAILDHQRQLKHGLICYATSDDLLIKQTQITLNNEFYWEKEPVTKQLDQLFEEYPRTGIILLQRDRVALIDTLLAEVMDEAHYEFDLNTEDWRRYKGIAFGAIISSSANHRDKYDRRLKEHQSRWFKELVPTIEKHAKEYTWKEVYLAGPTELTNKMKHLLPRLNIVHVVNQNYTGKSAHDIARDFLIK